jgi:hypothetical protein
MREFWSFFSMILVNRMMKECFQGLYHMFCLFYSYDLYLILQNPLYPQKKRLRWYKTLAFLVILIGVVGDLVYLRS